MRGRHSDKGKMKGHSGKEATPDKMSFYSVVTKSKHSLVPEKVETFHTKHGERRAVTAHLDGKKLYRFVPKDFKL